MVLKVGDTVVVTDNQGTTNGEHYGLMGKVYAIDEGLTYSINVDFQNGDFEFFSVEELTKVKGG